jgi:hypothetical protein
MVHAEERCAETSERTEIGTARTAYDDGWRCHRVILCYVADNAKRLWHSWKLTEPAELASIARRHHSIAAKEGLHPERRARGVECAVLDAGAVMPSVIKRVRCPYCRSERVRAEPVSKSGFSWHHCIPCGERFSARVADPPRYPMKARLGPQQARRKQS